MYSPDDAPLYVNARTEAEFAIARSREQAVDVDPYATAQARALNTGTWLTSMDRYRFGMRVEFPLDRLRG